VIAASCSSCHFNRSLTLLLVGQGRCVRESFAIGYDFSAVIVSLSRIQSVGKSQWCPTSHAEVCMSVCSVVLVIVINAIAC